MAVAKSNKYEVMVDIKSGQFTFTVKAESLEEAVAYAKEMKHFDVLNALEDWNDYNLEITGVFKV